MSVFIISYDLRKPDYDYTPLYDALAKVKAKHIQDSVWGLDTTSTAAEVYDYFWQRLHSAKDRLFVIPFDKSKDYKADNSINKLNSI